MNATKLSPPDTVGNVQGRILALQTAARRAAAADSREGHGYETALAKHLATVAGFLKTLERRLAAALKGSPEPVKVAKTSSTKKIKNPEMSDILTVLDTF